MRPCGQGVVDYDAILPLLYQHNPTLNLTIENASQHGRGLIQLWDPVWMASHPDLPRPSWPSTSGSSSSARCESTRAQCPP